MVNRFFGPARVVAAILLSAQFELGCQGDGTHPAPGSGRTAELLIYRHPPYAAPGVVARGGLEVALWRTRRVLIAQPADGPITSYVDGTVPDETFKRVVRMLADRRGQVVPPLPTDAGFLDLRSTLSRGTISRADADDGPSSPSGLILDIVRRSPIEGARTIDVGAANSIAGRSAAAR